MATTWTDGDPAVYLDAVTPAVRRRDAHTLRDLMELVTGEAPRMFGTSVIGFGDYHYEYASGHSGDAPAASFSPRKAASTVYLPDGVGAHDDLLARLGPHTTGVGCLYLKDLETVDLAVLEEILRRSWATVTGGTFGQRARES
jgi:predicted GIY-YIG superfamily endonuclease